MHNHRAKVLLGMGILILLISLYVVTFDTLIGGVGITVGLVTLFNSYQEFKGIKPRIIRQAEKREQEKLKEEAANENMYTRQRRLNNERQQQKQAEERKEKRFNIKD